MKSTSNGGERWSGVKRRVVKHKSPITKKPDYSPLLVIVLFALFLAAIVHITKQPTQSNIIATSTATSTIVAKEIKTPEKGKNEPKKQVSDPSLEAKLEVVRAIAKTFPENKTQMVAIAIEESGLNKNAVGYNCRYKIGGNTYDKLTGVYIDTSNIVKEKKAGYVSTWCRSGHNNLAWSKDGGSLMIHQPTSYEMTLKGNMETARSKYDKAGLNSWVAYSSGRYSKHTQLAKELLAMI